jgi:Uma2 family endonuclease
MNRSSVVSMSRPAYVAPSPHRFTREEYHRMGDAGLFADERVELLDGTIVTMGRQNSPYAGTTYQLHRLLARALGDILCVRTQLPIILDDWSEPVPDVAVCAPDPYHYAREHPTPRQVLLVCEVAVSSLAYDRSEKAAAYAASGIREYWIVDVENRLIQVLTDPEPAERCYRGERRAHDGDVVHVPGGGTLAVSEILPPL